MKKILLCGLLCGFFWHLMPVNAETWLVTPIVEKDDIKNISIIYPEFTNDYFNMTIKYFLEDIKKEYLANYQKGYQLIVTYQEFVSTDTLSYLFYMMYDFKGAHPITLIKTFNFNRNTYEQVTVKELFSKNDLQKISQFSYSDLEKRLTYSSLFIPEMLKSGTEPLFENFNNMIITDDGVVFYFKQYQVAPYAAGIQSCYIPYSTIFPSIYPMPR